MKTRLSVRLAAFIATVFAIPALAQYPADNQVGQVNNRVGGELYGNNTSSFTLRPYQVRLLPSEERNAVFRSGMLPSELELNRSSVGPLTPNGILDYIRPRSPLQEAMKLPSPQLYNPIYDLTLQPYLNVKRNNEEQSPVKTGFEGRTMTASKDKSKEAPSRALPALMPADIQPLPTGELPTGQLPSGQLYSRPETLPRVHTINRTMIRHGTILLRHPSTQPTPPPQPKP